MATKIILGIFALIVMYTTAHRIDSSSEEEENRKMLDSFKEFVRLVEKHNLNVTVVGSQNKYGSTGWLKESLSISLQMPVNNVFLTEATLDETRQNEYLTRIKKLGHKEHIGARSKVTQILNGQEHFIRGNSVNSQYLIKAPNGTILSTFRNGVAILENKTTEILYNYIITNDSSMANSGIKNVQVITAEVPLKELAVSEGFPIDVLSEIKNVLPKLWLGIDDLTTFTRLLVSHLEKKFVQHFQAMAGVEKFALGKKPYANIGVGNSNVLVFISS